MRIEAFTEAKDPRRPESNEDRIVALPGRVFAVIDGATDKSGRLHGGLTGGQIAANAVAATVAALAYDPAPPPSGPDLVARISEEIQSRYRALGLVAEAQADPLAQFSATLALALAVPGGWRFYRVGDSGIRLNGHALLLDESQLDPVYSQFRVALWHRYIAAGLAVDEVDRRSRQRLVGGAAHPSEDHALVTAARDEAVQKIAASHPDLAATEIRRILDRGLSSQTDYRGGDAPLYRGLDHPLGYGPQDGWPTPDRFIRIDEKPSQEIDKIELFTDGYYGVSEIATIAGWEGWLADIQRDDPYRIGRCPSTKGSAPGRNADDRSVLIVTDL